MSALGWRPSQPTTGLDKLARPFQDLLGILDQLLGLRDHPICPSIDRCSVQI